MGYPDHSRLVSVATELGMVRDLILYDDASRPKDWALSGTGADPTFAASTTFAFLGAKSWKLQTRSTTPADGDTAKASAKFQYPVKGRLFTGCRVFVPDVSQVKYARYSFKVFDGVRQYRYQVVFTYSTQEWSYWDAVGANVIIAENTVDLSDRCWVFMGFEIDINAQKWVRVVGMGRDHDNSGVAGDDVGATTEQQVTVQLEMGNAGAQQADVYWDCIFVTECECI